MDSTIFFIVGGFFSFGGCTGLEYCAPTVFLVVLSWLGGFFCDGFFCGGFVVSFDVLRLGVPSFVHSVSYSAHTSKHAINISTHNFPAKLEGGI
jgi:hypothetical protein